ncbi:DUF488 domain-containing protein [Paraburkholderia terrae]|uniref:DUF488 domain-containing protein n=1 Tax=Paraburkholderia terrae TaxID=311230 RepID=UPI0030E52E2C
MANVFFTIGHSTRTLHEFLTLLLGSRIDTLVDVRRIPRSRTNPQFNLETLPGALAPSVAYVHIAELGGRRGLRKVVPRSANGYWRSRSFHNYADYAMGNEFAVGFARLLELGRHGRCAIMCAATLWWQCHRRIIADYLITRGETVLHVIDVDDISMATLTPGARLQADGTLVYPEK